MTATAEYSVYLVRCRDGSLYTGIAKDVRRRMTEHEQGTKGAKYLRGRGPLELVFQAQIGDRSLATRIENRIKQLPRVEKQALVLKPEILDSLLCDLSGQ